MIKNQYIQSLIQANKLKHTVDTNIDFGFKIGKEKSRKRKSFNSRTMLS